MHKLRFPIAICLLALALGCSKKATEDGKAAHESDPTGDGEPDDGSNDPFGDGESGDGSGGATLDGGNALDGGQEPGEGDAGSVDGPVPGTCSSEASGWATVAGDGVDETTGGAAGPTVRPASAQELMALASDAEPRVIELEGTFDVPSLQVNSNKTLVGVGGGATIRGGLRVRGRENAPVSNIIIRNLKVNGATTEVDNDAVQLQFAHHVWIDHCEIFDGPDGNLDMTHAVDWVTVSWTKFLYTANYQRPESEPNDHRFSSLIGHSDDNASEDEGRLRISFHHNWWAERVIERMPRVRFGQVHVFNNYFASAGNNYCVRAGRGARLLIEANYFDGVNSPHEFNDERDQATAFIVARDNVYDGTTGAEDVDGGGTPFERAPYFVVLDSADELPALITRCAGPR